MIHKILLTDHQSISGSDYEMSDGEDDLFVHDDSYDPDKAGFQFLFAVMPPLSANK